MDKQEARLLLQSYRPGGQDAQDPAFAEALALARQDPELRAWFAAESKLDQAISKRVRESAVPEDLRPSILAGQRSQRQLVRATLAWWKSPVLAWAAAIALLFVAAVFFHGGSNAHVALALYRNAMTANLQSGFAFDVQDSQPAHIQEWLAEHMNLKELQLPETLNKTIGCKVFEFDKLKPALICFTLPDQKMVHLFVVDGARFDGKDFKPKACASRCNDYYTMAWRDAKWVYLLAGNVDPVRLNEIASQLKKLSPDGPDRPTQ